jgi:hypothetical protein
MLSDKRRFTLFLVKFNCMLLPTAHFCDMLLCTSLSGYMEDICDVSHMILGTNSSNHIGIHSLVL